MQRQPQVGVIDDDESVRESLPDLLETIGFAALPFASAEAFLASDALSTIECLIVDVSMPGMSGPELQAELKRRQINVPIIFITGECQPGLRASLLASGAAECLLKPFSEQALRAALATAMRKP